MFKRQRIERLIASVENLHLAEYLQYQKDRKRRLTDAFLVGVLKGLGAMVGFAVLGTMVIIILRRLAQQNLPVISDFLAQVVTMVEARLK